MNVGIPAASGDGSRVVIVPEEGCPADVMVYNANNGALSKAPLTFSHNAYDYRPAINGDGARMIVSDSAQTPVYDQTYTLFCTLPADTRAYTVDHSNLRAHVVDSSSRLRVFDVATDTNGGACLQIGTDTLVFDVGIDPAGFGFPSSNVRMTISPNGVNLFMAGVNGVLVIPVP
jgi:hypothetical protein